MQEPHILTTSVQLFFIQANLMPPPSPCSCIMALASHKLGLFLCSLAHGLLLLSPLVHCDEDKDTLFKAMNGYRSSIKLSNMTRNSKADCLVQQIAWDFDDEAPLSIFTSGSTIAPSNFSQLPSLPDYLSNCKIELNHTKNGAILPLYIPNLALNLVLYECTRSQMAKYLSKPEYTSVGIGYYQQWAVFAFGTDSPAGNFSSSANLSDLGLRHFFLVSSLLLGLFIFI